MRKFAAVLYAVLLTAPLAVISAHAAELREPGILKDSPTPTP
jgi:hypothetical protein